LPIASPPPSHWRDTLGGLPIIGQIQIQGEYITVGGIISKNLEKWCSYLESINTKG